MDIPSQVCLKNSEISLKNQKHDWIYIYKPEHLKTGTCIIISLPVGDTNDDIFLTSNN